MFTQNRFGRQMFGAAATTAAATSGLIQQVLSFAAAAGMGSDHDNGRCVGQWQMSRHFVTDDTDTLGWKESDIESAFTSPPHALFRRRHIDHRNHITHLLESDEITEWRTPFFVQELKDGKTVADQLFHEIERLGCTRICLNLFYAHTHTRRRIAWLLLLFQRLASSDYTVQIMWV